MRKLLTLISFFLVGCGVSKPTTKPPPCDSTHWNVTQKDSIKWHTINKDSTNWNITDKDSTRWHYYDKDSTRIHYNDTTITDTTHKKWCCKIDTTHKDTTVLIKHLKDTTIYKIKNKDSIVTVTTAIPIYIPANTGSLTMKYIIKKP